MNTTGGFFEIGQTEGLDGTPTINDGTVQWRDRILILVCWGVLFFSALADWASDGLPIAEMESLGLDQWGLLEAFIHTILPFVILFLPVFLWAANLLPSFSLSRWRKNYQHQSVFWWMYLASNLGMVALWFEELREARLFGMILLTLVVALVFWLFYQRIEVDLQKGILCGTTWGMIILSRQTLAALQGRIDILHASWLTRTAILLIFAPMLGSIVLPLAVLLFRNRIALPELQRRFEKIPLGVWVAMLLFTTSWTFASSLAIDLVAVARLCVGMGGIGILLSTGGLLLWVVRGEKPQLTRAGLPMGKRSYWILMSLVLILYGILAWRIGINRIGHINPDGLSYLTIAREVAEGNLVVRGYWAPLISWLIAPLISIGVPPQEGYFYVMGVSGFLWILVSMLLAKRFGIREAGRLSIAGGIILTTLATGFWLVTPDVLGAVFILFYFYWITDPAYDQKPMRYGLLAGLAGALAYYAKYYNLPFVLAHLLMHGGIRWLADKKHPRSIVRGTLMSIMVLVILCAPWVWAMHDRYGEFTISTSGAIAHAVMGPGSTGHPCWDSQLCDQPEDALFPWEDPQQEDYPALGWNPFGSLWNFRFQVRLIQRNIWNWIAETSFQLGVLFPIAILCAGLASIVYWRDHSRRMFFGWMFLTVMLYVAGYMMNYSSAARYYLAILPLALIMAFIIIQSVIDHAGSMLPARNIPLINVAAACVLLISVLSFGDFDLIQLSLALDDDHCLETGTQHLAPFLEGPIAGTDHRINDVAYYSRVRTLGALGRGVTVQAADEQLRAFGVRTLVLAPGSLATGLMETYHYPVVFQSELCGEDVLLLKVRENWETRNEEY